MTKYLIVRLINYLKESIYLFRKNCISACLLFIAPLMTVIINFFWLIISGNQLFSNEIAIFFTSGSLFAAIMTTAVTVGVSYNTDDATHFTEILCLSIVVIVTTLFMGFQSGYLADKSLSNHSIASSTVIFLEIIGLSIVLVISMHFRASQEDGFIEYQMSATHDVSTAENSEINNNNSGNELDYLKKESGNTVEKDE